MSLELPTLPTSPISRPEFNRRIKAAGLMLNPNPNAKFQAFNATDEGTLLVTPPEVGTDLLRTQPAGRLRQHTRKRERNPSDRRSPRTRSVRRVGATRPDLPGKALQAT